MRPAIVCVEGLIGAGKTKLLQSVSLTETLHVIQEPVEEFRSMGQYNPLEIMYSNPSETITVQAYIQGVLRKHWEKHLTSDQILLTERTPYSTNIFSKHLRDKGVLTQFQYDYLDHQMQETIEALNLPALGCDKLFFLDVPVEVCLDRVAKRGRQEEQQQCDHEYLSGLSAYMQDFLVRFRRHKGESKVLVTHSTDLDALRQELLAFAHASL